MSTHTSTSPKSAFLDQRWGLVAIALVLLTLDYFSGPDINFPVLYVFPVMVAAWKFDFCIAALLAVSMTAVRFFFLWLWDFPDGLGTTTINNLMRCAALLLVAFLTVITARQNRVLCERVRKLERLLPLCPKCDAIRGENGQWQPLDEVAKKHTKPQVACPECSGTSKDPFAA